jgi:hypothetical protein
MIRTLSSTPQKQSPSFRAKRGISLLLWPVALLFAALPASAQVKTGTPPFGSFGGGPDVINLANLNSHIAFPFLQRSGRGMDFTYAMSYDSSVWYPVTSSGTTSWQPVSNWGWRGQTEVIAAYITYKTTTNLGCYSIQHVLYQRGTRFDNFVYHDMFGIPHPFIGSLFRTQSPCLPSSDNFTATATDGSGYTFNSNGNVLTSSDGRVIHPPLIVSSQVAGSMTDRNGNQISASGTGVFTDTLGTTVLTVSGVAPSNTTFTYTAPSGAEVVPPLVES